MAGERHSGRMGPGNSHDAQRVAPRSTYEQALRFLEFRARSVEELRRKLIQKGCPAEEVREALDRLQEQRLLNDADFARQFARTRVMSAGASRHRIAQELRRRGIAREVADAALETLMEAEGIDLTASIYRVAEKKWKSLAKLDDFTRRRRLYAFLARRGFNPDEIRGAMSRLAEELRD